MQPPLTQCAQKVIEQARAEAKKYNQSFVNSEHVFLALVTAHGCHSSRLFRTHRVDTEALRTNLLAVMPYSEMPPAVTGELPLSAKAQKLINNANVLAKHARDQKITTRYLLMSLMEDSSAPFIRALKNVGVDVDTLKRDASEKPTDAET
jgi:ATP-dependent Clp protease ATP-binding subunit ClpB